MSMRRFRQYSLKEFEEFIRGVQVKRKINHIQIHHTWLPRKKDYRGELTIFGMWRYHTEVKGWQDIGQHFSVAPDGTIWDGRSLELNPAGIKNHNTGGLMFEIIGDFNVGAEVLENSQLYSVTRAVVICQEKFGLKNPDIVFHREIDASKSCPGTSIEKFWFLNMVDRARFPKPTENMPVIQRQVQGTYNQEPVEVPAYLIGGQTYVPLRFFAEKMGARIHWDGERYHVDNTVWE